MITVRSLILVFCSLLLAKFMDPDPHWDFSLDPDPQKKTNVDPQHWSWKLLFYQHFLTALAADFLLHVSAVYLSLVTDQQISATLLVGCGACNWPADIPRFSICRCPRCLSTKYLFTQLWSADIGQLTAVHLLYMVHNWSENVLGDFRISTRPKKNSYSK
jgi:hypothetical protein